MKYEDYAKIRDSRGVKDGTIASATGIGRSTFSDWKAGRSMPKQDKLIKIAEYLHVGIEEMVSPCEHIPFLGDEPTKQAMEDFDILVKIRQLSPTNKQILLSTIDTMLRTQ